MYSSDPRRRTPGAGCCRRVNGTGTPILLAAVLAAGCSSSEPASRQAPEPAGEVAEAGAEVGDDSGPGTESFAGYPVRCRRGWVDLAAWIPPIAEDLERQKILYGSVPLSDCSGIFHRFLRAFDQGCPGYSLPRPESDRDSRDLARWYQERGLLAPVRDELGQVDLIKPGAVMFYGRSGKSYPAVDVGQILRQTEHVGVVVAVERDGHGALVRYRLFHGRSHGKTAGVTDYHLRQPPRPALRPFGNWDQQWIAFAPLADGRLRRLADR